LCWPHSMALNSMGQTAKFESMITVLVIENEYLHLKNGILDQSAILLSKYGYLTWMDCKTREYDIANFSELQKCQQSVGQATYKILLAFSGLKEPLMRNSGYNTRVSECREAAETLLE
ncbi:hypothetical protein BHM03_00033381, partial [Ensete ventricosum]